MKIVIVSSAYSEGMGYAENCLPKVLVKLGHEVHLVATNWNIYGNLDIYDSSYRSFLGEADQGTGTFEVDGYTVHRMPSKLISNYVYTIGLFGKIKQLSPDIVHSMEIASLQTFVITLIKPFFKFNLFTETHQHMSVVKDFLKKPGSHYKKIIYKLTRTLPSFLASFQVKKCYAISPDCAEVANIFYGVPKKKIEIQSLGTDTQLFFPSENKIERSTLRSKLKYNDEDIVLIYTGRFSADKNPLLIAEAISILVEENPNIKGLFIGEGQQKDEILNKVNVTVLPFMRHRSLAEYYKVSDIAIWPTQESMSMLDAAASGLPLIVSNSIGESERINGNGASYKENDVNDLCKVILGLLHKETRIRMGDIGRKKMKEFYSWENIGKKIEQDFYTSLK
jgi:glycosyltransferase involved in cell wall biosynthesis